LKPQRDNAAEYDAASTPEATAKIKAAKLAAKEKVAKAKALIAKKVPKGAAKSGVRRTQGCG
jgi:hypothetical protein